MHYTLSEQHLRRLCEINNFDVPTEPAYHVDPEVMRILAEETFKTRGGDDE